MTMPRWETPSERANRKWLYLEPGQTWLDKWRSLDPWRLPPAKLVGAPGKETQGEGITAASYLTDLNQLIKIKRALGQMTDAEGEQLYMLAVQTLEKANAGVEDVAAWIIPNSTPYFRELAVSYEKRIETLNSAINEQVKQELQFKKTQGAAAAAEEQNLITALTTKQKQMRQGEEWQASDALRKSIGQAQPQAANPIEEFEQTRKQMLEKYSSPKDWIQNYQWRAKTNPYYPTGNAMSEAQSGMSRALGEQAYWVGVAEGYKSDPEITSIASGAAARAGERATEWSRQAAELNRTGWRGPSASPQQATTPITPGWLAPFAYGQREGQPLIEQGGVTTPSGQAWTSMPPLQRQMLAGYSEWVGKPFADVEHEMELMQPRTPTRNYVWRVRRQ